MANRRKFLLQSILSSLGIGTLGMQMGNSKIKATNAKNNIAKASKKPLVLSTWDHGLAANEAAWKILYKEEGKEKGEKKSRAIDAVEAGVRIPEADPKVKSVGYGGLPDRDGKVTLDACIMDETGNCGSVAFLQHIKHPISVARKVMDDTPHVMLSGEGALRFALENGFEKEELLTEDAKKDWEAWKKKSEYNPWIYDDERHDTIGLLALDDNGDLAGACTTSGLAYKMHGRVGDSPIIGAGLYVDNEIGAATATGVGELVMKTLGSFLIVELMRQGMTPQEACEEGIKRIADKIDITDLQVGYLAVNKAGDYGAYAIRSGFKYAIQTKAGNELVEADYMVK